MWSMKGFIRSLNDVRHSEMAIETMCKYMDTHLELLHKALEEDDKEEIAFQKNQLEKIRVRLVELEYFNFNYGRV